MNFLSNLNNGRVKLPQIDSTIIFLRPTPSILSPSPSENLLLILTNILNRLYWLHCSLLLFPFLWFINLLVSLFEPKSSFYRGLLFIRHLFISLSSSFLNILTALRYKNLSDLHVELLVDLLLFINHRVRFHVMLLYVLAF